MKYYFLVKRISIVFVVFIATKNLVFTVYCTLSLSHIMASECLYLLLSEGRLSYQGETVEDTDALPLEENLLWDFCCRCMAHTAGLLQAPHGIHRIRTPVIHKMLFIHHLTWYLFMVGNLTLFQVQKPQLCLTVFQFYRIPQIFPQNVRRGKKDT